MIEENNKPGKHLVLQTERRFKLHYLEIKPKTLLVIPQGKQGATSKPDNPHQMEKFLEI